jgi:hypothetical protein
MCLAHGFRGRCEPELTLSRTSYELHGACRYCTASLTSYQGCGGRHRASSASFKHHSNGRGEEEEEEEIIRLPWRGQCGRAAAARALCACCAAGYAKDCTGSPVCF